MRTRTLALGLIAAVSASSISAQVVASQKGLARPVIDKPPGGVPRVMNSGPTRWADTNGWKLAYERTVQPAEGAAGRLENPSIVVLASDGRLVTLDQINPAIRLYDPTGKFLRALGRAGEGPGEYKAPVIALFRDSLFIFDPQLRRITVMTLDGKVARTMPSPTLDQFPISFDARGRLAVHTSKRVADHREGQWVYFTRAGVPVDSLKTPQPLDTKSWPWQTPEGPQEWTIPFPPGNVTHLLPDGTAAYGRTDSYMLMITRTGTDTLRIFGRTDAPRISIPMATRDSAFQAQLTRQPRLAGVAKLADLPLTYPLWRSLQTDASGNIWVRARTDRPERTRFDVFAPDGVFLGTVSGPFAGSAVVSFDGDRVIVIDVDADDLPRIRIYRIDRRGR